MIEHPQLGETLIIAYVGCPQLHSFLRVVSTFAVSCRVFYFTLEIVGNTNLVKTSRHDAVIAHDFREDPSSSSLHGTYCVITPEQQHVTFIAMSFLTEKTTENQCALCKTEAEESKYKANKEN